MTAAVIPPEIVTEHRLVPPVPAAKAPPAADAPACASLLALQRSAGNAVVARLLDPPAKPSRFPAAAMQRPVSKARFERALSRCSCCGGEIPKGEEECDDCRRRGEATASALARIALERGQARVSMGVLARSEDSQAGDMCGPEADTVGDESLATEVSSSDPVPVDPVGSDAESAQPASAADERASDVSPYDQGRQDGLRGQEPAPGPLNEDGLADYDRGCQTGRAEADGQTPPTSVPPGPLDADAAAPQGEMGPLVVGATALGPVAKYSAAAGETAVVGEAGATSGVFAVGTGATVGGTEVATGTAVAMSSPAAPAAAAGLAIGTVLVVVGIAVLVAGAAVWLTRVVSEPPPEGSSETPMPGTTPAPAAGQAVPSPPVPAESEPVPEASNGNKWRQPGGTIQTPDDPWRDDDDESGNSSESDNSCDGPMYRSYPKCSTRRFGSSKEALEDVRKNYPANPAENLRGLENAVLGNARGAKRLGPFTTKHLGIYSTPAKDEYVGTMFEQDCCENVNGQAQIRSVWTHNLPG